MRSIIGMSLVAALAVGCGTEATEPTETVEFAPPDDETAAEEAADPVAEADEADETDEADDLATPADFEEEASTAITPENLEEQVTDLEAAVAADLGESPAAE